MLQNLPFLSQVSMVKPQSDICGYITAYLAKKKKQQQQTKKREEIKQYEMRGLIKAPEIQRLYSWKMSNPDSLDHDSQLINDRFGFMWS
jgi:hypothetical protein